MKFLTIPKNGASWQQPLVYAVELGASDGSDAHVEIVDADNSSIASFNVYGKSSFEVDISPYIIKGKNVFEITVINNLRNMQGPLHMNSGDDARVSPGSFFRESNVFVHAGGKGEGCHDVLGHFNEKIGLVHFGLDK